MTAIRGAKFTGASGRVSLDSVSGERLIDGLLANVMCVRPVKDIEASTNWSAVDMIYSPVGNWTQATGPSPPPYRDRMVSETGR